MKLSAMISTLSDTLASSKLSAVLQETEWVVPAVQTVHILSVATVISSATFVSLRLLNVNARELTGNQVALRFLPLIWWTLPVLLVSGSLLIIAEPARSLGNPAFYVKMALLLAASALTLTYQWPLRAHGDFWERSGARVATTKLIALVSLTLWVGVIVAGRFIAYVGDL
jgi:hypothetical protein